MKDFREQEYKVFEMFSKQWAIVSAGSVDDFGGCTIGWGSLGTLWGRPGSDGSIVTVYVYPARNTLKYLKNNATFTVSFFPETYKKALGYMGSHSSRDEDKAANAGLSPIAFGDSVTYQEASLTFRCRKIYQHEFSKDDVAPDIQEYYKSNPKAYPLDENGEWQTHWVIVGEILEVKEQE